MSFSSLSQDPEVIVEQWWAENLSVPEFQLQASHWEVFFLCTILSAGTELHMSLRDVWVRCGWAGVVNWSGVSIARSCLDCIFPIFSIGCWMSNKQILFDNYWHHLCTQQPQHWSLASSWETAAVGIVLNKVNGLTPTYSEGTMKQSSRESCIWETVVVDELLFASLLSNLSVSSFPSATDNDYCYFYWHNISSSETLKWSPVIGAVQNRT